MLHDGLAAAERAGQARRAAFGNRAKRVNVALAGRERAVRREFLFVRAAFADFPFRHHRHVNRHALRRRDCRDRLIHREIPFANRRDRSRHAARRHDAMRDNRRFLHVAENVARFDRCADRDRRDEMPRFGVGNAVGFHATRQKCADLRLQGVERALNPVINRAEQSRPKFDGERAAGRINRIAGAKPFRRFIDLNRSRIAAQFDDFPDQAFFADMHDFVHLHVLHPIGHD